MRWREETANGRSPEEAVLETMDHAGRAVIFSGIAVAIGLLALVVLPVPFLRSIGYGGLLIPLISVLVAIDPAAGDPRDHRPAPGQDRLLAAAPRTPARAGCRGAGSWSSTAGSSGLVSLCIMGLLFVPVLDFSTGSPRADALASSGSARDGLTSLEDSGLGAGVLSPYEVVVVEGDPDATAKTDRRAWTACSGPSRRPARPGAAATPPSSRSSPPRRTPLDRDGGARTRSTWARARSWSAARTPGVVDFNDAVYGNFICVILVILVVTYILLARVFRSLLLPLKAIIFNVISIGAVWGFMVIFWQKGHGSGAIFNIEPTGALTVWIPLMVFAFLYGLSMDYEVFILSRMREEYDRDGSTDRAVVAGLARTGRLVTAGSLILFLAFTALASGPETDIKVFATALAIGILVDATIVRSMMLPAFVSLFGRWNWWMPTWAARILRVRAEPPAAGEARRTGPARPSTRSRPQLTAPPLPGLSPGRGRPSPARWRRRRGAMASASPAAMSAAIAPSHSEVLKPASDGTEVPGIVLLAIRVTAAWLPITLPTVRHDRVHAGGDAGLGGAHGVGDQLGHRAEGDGHAAGADRVAQHQLPWLGVQRGEQGRAERP